jgi:hypothetical protein
MVRIGAGCRSRRNERKLGGKPRRQPPPRLRTDDAGMQGWSPGRGEWQ